MDFLDPKKQRRHTVLLLCGYVLIGIAIVISTIILIYQANGYGVNGRGEVTQSGLLLFSSQPNPANIYVDGKDSGAQTNARMSLAAGQYNIALKRAGYRTWQHQITVQGGDVQHFSYPFLFPTTPSTKSIANYDNGASLASQSRDQRWLVVQQTAAAGNFDLYDLKNPTQPVTELSVPADVAHAGTVQIWEVVQWADDNTHLLIKHTYDGNTEYVLLDRSDPTKSINLNKELGVTPAALTLIDNKYDQYDVLMTASGDLDTASLGNPKPQKVLSNVLSYKSYGSKTILYVASEVNSSAKVQISIFDGTKSWKIREAAAGTTYLLDMAGYSGTPYIIVGASSENEAYVYQDPLSAASQGPVLPIRALKVKDPNYVAFSPTAQYIVVESGSQFGVYDIFLKHAFVYNLPQSLDAPQPHATWMDGNRLTYISGGKLFVVDFDRQNPQMLDAASANYVPFFSPDYHYVYTLAPAAKGLKLQQTSLLVGQ